MTGFFSDDINFSMDVLSLFIFMMMFSIIIFAGTLYYSFNLKWTGRIIMFFLSYFFLCLTGLLFLVVSSNPTQERIAHFFIEKEVHFILVPIFSILSLGFYTIHKENSRKDIAWIFIFDLKVWGWYKNTNECTPQPCNSFGRTDVCLHDLVFRKYEKFLFSCFCENCLILYVGNRKSGVCRKIPGYSRKRKKRNRIWFNAHNGDFSSIPHLPDRNRYNPPQNLTKKRNVRFFIYLTKIDLKSTLETNEHSIYHLNPYRIAGAYGFIFFHLFHE